MKTIIIFLAIVLIGCSETSVNNVKSVSDTKNPSIFNVYVVNSNSKFGGDSVQVNSTSVILFRDGDVYLEYPLEQNPVISIF